MQEDLFDRVTAIREVPHGLWSYICQIHAELKKFPNSDDHANLQAEVEELEAMLLEYLTQIEAAQISLFNEWAKDNNIHRVNIGTIGLTGSFKELEF